MNEAELTRLTRQLADIDMPDEPANWLLSPGVALVTVVVLAVALSSIQIIRRRRPGPASNSPQSLHPQLLEKLSRLEADWRAGRIDDQVTAFRLATLIRQALRLNQLTAEPPPGLPLDEAAWRTLYLRLHRLRYRASGEPNPVDAIDTSLFRQIRAIIEEAGSW